MDPFDIREVRELMEDDELELDTIGDEKTALLLIMSDTDTTFNFILAMVQSQLINLLCDRVDDKYGGRLPVHVRMIIRTFTVTLATVLCLTASSTTAFAGGTDPDPEPLPETTEAPQEEEPTTDGMEPEGVPVTLEGNATLVDDFYGDKQLITVTTKAGNYFYILIDRANEDKETAVHFLNQVDDADLQALLEDGEAAPETCTCTTKCEAGAVNTNCPVCKTNMTECTGPEPEPQEPKETDPPQEEEAKSTSMGGLVVFLVVALIGGGATLYFFKFRKPKADTKGGDELDEFDFGEDEDDEDEPTTEDGEPTEEKSDCP